tara:strand:- start:1092 stop:1268 length:177 start_codon:yes stop_codon:yes gene_type:complete
MIPFDSYFAEEKYPNVFEIISKEIEIHKIFFNKIKKRDKPFSLLGGGKEVNTKKTPSN